MTSERELRYICFCGISVIGLPVCSRCAERMVAALLGQATAFAVPGRSESGPPGDEGGKEGLEPASPIAV